MACPDSLAMQMLDFDSFAIDYLVELRTGYVCLFASLAWIVLYWSGLVVLVLVAFADLVVEMVMAVVVVLALLSVALNYLDYTSDVVGMLQELPTDSEGFPVVNYDSAHVSEGTTHDSDDLYSIADCDTAVAVAAQCLL